MSDSPSFALGGAGARSVICGLDRFQAMFAVTRHYLSAGAAKLTADMPDFHSRGCLVTAEDAVLGTPLYAFAMERGVADVKKRHRIGLNGVCHIGMVGRYHLQSNPNPEL